MNVHPLREAIGAHLGRVLTPEVATSIELAALAAAKDPHDHRAVEVYGGDMDSGGVLAVVTRIPGGFELESHRHVHGHMSVLAKGTADVTINGETTRYTGPTHVCVPPDSQHKVHAVTDVVWYCLWSEQDAPREQIEESLHVLEPLNSIEPIDPIEPTESVAPVVEKIKLLTRGVNVQPLYWALMANPQVWNQHPRRTEHPDSPHYQLDDVWVRYGEEARIYDQLAHFPDWYPEADVLGIKPLLRDLVRMVDGDILGGVLITRIPAGSTCKPHTDDGWHARFYEKYAIQIASAPGQKFCFEGQELETAPGDVFWFNNQHLHWVENPTPYDRITLIACIK